LISIKIIRSIYLIIEPRGMNGYLARKKHSRVGDDLFAAGLCIIFDIGEDTRTGLALVKYRYDVPFKFTGK
jgi:hypothetical protein